jgi:redox-regulated HSP33 family molecular chaperone
VLADTDTLAGCLEAYFSRSEQLPTRLWLAADGQRRGRPAAAADAGRTGERAG